MRVLLSFITTRAAAAMPTLAVASNGASIGGTLFRSHPEARLAGRKVRGIPCRSSPLLYLSAALLAGCATRPDRSAAVADLAPDRQDPCGDQLRESDPRHEGRRHGRSARRVRRPCARAWTAAWRSGRARHVHHARARWSRRSRPAPSTSVSSPIDPGARRGHELQRALCRHRGRVPRAK